MTHEETDHYHDSVYERIANHYNLTSEQYYDISGLDGREKTAYLNDNGNQIYFSESVDEDFDTSVNVPAEPDTVSTEDASQNSTIE